MSPAAKLATGVSLGTAVGYTGFSLALGASDGEWPVGAEWFSVVISGVAVGVIALLVVLALVAFTGIGRRSGGGLSGE
ncbi:hypothetical protein [Nocardia lijiangensis]|uniref:hypothetical protein n=1 Tax=Nocardia lijiangensis TaxID=299618 RepID=UPI000A8B06A8|nr:hypothetical protein [Nocardia lijiangensis]